MVPGACRTDFDDVAGNLAAPAGELGELVAASLAGADAAAVGGKTAPEREGDQRDLFVLADRARSRRGLAQVARRPQELGMGVAQLTPREPAALVLGEEMASGEPVVDLTSAVVGAHQRLGSEAHGTEG